MPGVIAALLLIVAALLAFEAIFPITQFRALSQDPIADIPIALGAGLIVGAISSLLGVGRFLSEDYQVTDVREEPKPH